MTLQKILEEISLQNKLPNVIDQTCSIIITNYPDRYFTSERQQLKSNYKTEVYYPVKSILKGIELGYEIFEAIGFNDEMVNVDEDIEIDNPAFIAIYIEYRPKKIDNQ